MVIVVDTSVWVEWLRGSAHPAAARLEKLVADRAELAITETVLMEVLAGARSGSAMDRARSRLMAFPVLRLNGLPDFEEAASIYRACRIAGYTLRSQLDLLIAVPTIRHRASLLHNDRDFEVIARHSDLKLEPIALTPEDGHPGVRERSGRYARRRPQAKPREARTSARRSVA